MKQFWHEFCIQAYIQRFSLIALLLVVAIWILLAELIIPREVLDVIVYCAFGWFVLGEVLVPWVERKLNKLFN